MRGRLFDQEESREREAVIFREEEDRLLQFFNSQLGCCPQYHRIRRLRRQRPICRAEREVSTAAAAAEIVKYDSAIWRSRLPVRQAGCSSD